MRNVATDDGLDMPVDYAQLPDGTIVVALPETTAETLADVALSRAKAYARHGDTTLTRKYQVATSIVRDALAGDATIPADDLATIGLAAFRTGPAMLSLLADACQATVRAGAVADLRTDGAGAVPDQRLGSLAQALEEAAQAVIPAEEGSA